ncbi:hypothetical protein D9758_006801 [Tetrapyrgos nigripes]|uniref:Uncharacterized protein n=1 Tax=Tetrapyrgos nigripes TaxID=182062 RepID=A0A8H5CV77_9AGAR|nr:hypothetical protein D9758_006801 [Tetrapyrgos nigripes]
MPHSQVSLAVILSLLILVISLANPIFLSHFHPRTEPGSVPKRKYSKDVLFDPTSSHIFPAYVDDDWPEFLPLDLPDVLMTMEESRHYPITGPDVLEEWASTAARGFGYLQLGEQKRLFALSMFHQFHCLRLMRYALEGRHDAGSRGHMQHCNAIPIPYVQALI